LLRNELGFEGLTITDDLEMGAIVKNYGIGEASIMALNAGNDMVAICAGVDPILEARETVHRAVADRRLDTALIDKAVERIFHLKAQISGPFAFDAERIALLSRRITELNGSLS
jgi:beta-N-acetylhexosaminidase